ncbi:MAG TPA: hypothetical protein VFN35_13210, partial [Ktedonobacteraceae bacterium]|nr:hypothetical protein [Ktedonobacteraceae bacterium]
RVGSTLKSPAGLKYAKGLAAAASRRLSSNSHRLTFLRRPTRTTGPLDLRSTRKRLPRLTGITRSHGNTSNT